MTSTAIMHIQPPVTSLGKHVVNPWSDRSAEGEHSSEQDATRHSSSCPRTCAWRATALLLALFVLTDRALSGQHPSCLCPFLSRRIPRLSCALSSAAVIVQLCNAQLARASSCCSCTRLNFHCRNAAMILLIKVYIIFKLQPGVSSPTVQIGPIRNAYQHRLPDKV